MPEKKLFYDFCNQSRFVWKPEKTVLTEFLHSTVPGGEGGIRTLEGGKTLPAFQASALDQLCDLSIRAKQALNLYSILDFQNHSVVETMVIKTFITFYADFHFKVKYCKQPLRLVVPAQ